MAGAIRQPIDLDALNKYIEKELPEIQTPLEVKQFGYGQSNPTYLLTSKNGQRYVMRKKPPGKLLSKTAHRIDREYKIIHALEKTDVAVPKAFGLCEDDSVIGTPFYIMSFLDGRIFEDPAIPEVSAEHRRLMWKDAIETLAKFHRVDFKSVGLEKYGKHSGFYNRQLMTFATISTVQSEVQDVDTKEPVGKIPHFDEMVDFFQDEATQPKDRSTLVHGDYKIDNIVFHKTEPRVIGILDWEMSTIGHPLSDVCNLMMPYTTADSKRAQAIGRAHPGFLAGAIPGLPTKEECLSWYAAVAGWHYPPAEFTWGEAFSTYRGSIIMQGIAARFARRQASSAKAKDYAVQMKPFGEVAWELVESAKRQVTSSPKL